MPFPSKFPMWVFRNFGGEAGTYVAKYGGSFPEYDEGYITGINPDNPNVTYFPADSFHDAKRKAAKYMVETWLPQYSADDPNAGENGLDASRFIGKSYTLQDGTIVDLSVLSDGFPTLDAAIDILRYYYGDAITQSDVGDLVSITPNLYSAILEIWTVGYSRSDTDDLEGLEPGGSGSGSGGSGGSGDYYQNYWIIRGHEGSLRQRVGQATAKSVFSSIAENTAFGASLGAATTNPVITGASTIAGAIYGFVDGINEDGITVQKLLRQFLRDIFRAQEIEVLNPTGKPKALVIDGFPLTKSDINFVLSKLKQAANTISTNSKDKRAIRTAIQSLEVTDERLSIPATKAWVVLFKKGGKNQFGGSGDAQSLLSNIPIIGGIVLLIIYLFTRG